MATIAVDISESAVNQENIDLLRESYRALRGYCDRLESLLKEEQARIVEEHVKAEHAVSRLVGFIHENRAGSPFPDFVPIYRHRKRGSTYDILAVCRAQVSGTPLKDNDRVVVYRNKENMVFVRGFSEFMDGRFEWIG